MRLGTDLWNVGAGEDTADIESSHTNEEDKDEHGAICGNELDTGNPASCIFGIKSENQEKKPLNIPRSKQEKNASYLPP